MSDARRWMSAIAVAACALVAGVPASAQDAPARSPVPPMPDAGQVERAMATLGRPTNNPIPGADSAPRVAGGARPPSLEALQALRPGTLAPEGAEGLRAQAVCQEGESYGARGGLAAKGFGITEMLRRYEAQLDIAFDFDPLLVGVGPRTLLRPPVVTEAQMAFALAEGGQQARATGRVYRITREGALAAVPPNWRSYLVPVVQNPTPPAEAMRPRTDKEARMWDGCVAKGWAEGERLAMTNFLSAVGTLEQEFIGMARYHVLQRAGLVEPAKVAVRHIRVQGGGRDMRLDDTTTTITGPGRLQPDPNRWRPTPEVPANGPIGTIGAPSR